MKGIKLGIFGITFCLLGLSIATNNIYAASCAAIGVLLALIGCFLSDK